MPRSASSARWRSGVASASSRWRRDGGGGGPDCRAIARLPGRIGAAVTSPTTAADLARAAGGVTGRRRRRAASRAREAARRPGDVHGSAICLRRADARPGRACRRARRGAGRGGATAGASGSGAVPSPRRQPGPARRAGGRERGPARARRGARRRLGPVRHRRPHVLAPRPRARSSAVGFAAMAGLLLARAPVIPPPPGPWPRGPAGGAADDAAGARRRWLRHVPAALLAAGIPFALLALADPHASLVASEVSYPGRRIALMIDASDSMRSEFSAPIAQRRHPAGLLHHRGRGDPLRRAAPPRARTAT